MIHRNLKSENVLVDQESNVKLTGFRSSRPINNSLMKQLPLVQLKEKMSNANLRKELDILKLTDYDMRNYKTSMNKIKTLTPK